MTNKSRAISVREDFGENLLTPEEGLRLYDLIHPELQASRDVVLDFDGVKVVGSAFLNQAIGKLYADIAPDVIKTHLRMPHISDIAKFALKKVVANSKEYYQNSRFREALDASVDSAFEA